MSCRLDRESTWEIERIAVGYCAIYDVFFFFHACFANWNKSYRRTSYIFFNLFFFFFPWVFPQLFGVSSFLSFNAAEKIYRLFKKLKLLESHCPHRLEYFTYVFLRYQIFYVVTKGKLLSDQSIVTSSEVDLLGISSGGDW